MNPALFLFSGLEAFRFLSPITPIRHITLTMPAFNEAASIEELIQRAVKVLQDGDHTWNVIVVDDGSSDQTAAIVEKLSSTESQIHLVRHAQNMGLGPAILTGLSKAVELTPGEGVMIVCMDADLTHPPELIPEMCRAADLGADLVIASRFQPGSRVLGLGAFRHLLSWGARVSFAWTLKLPNVRDYTCGFRGFRASLIEDGFEAFGKTGLITRRGFACTDELLVKLALLDPVIREIPFTLRYDLKRGKSKIKLGITITETLRLISWGRRQLRARKSGIKQREMHE